MRKVLILVGTLYPFIWLFLYAVNAFGTINWPVHLGVLFAIVATMSVYYIFHVVKNDQLKNDTKVIWILGLTFFGSIAHIAYFIGHLSAEK